MRSFAAKIRLAVLIALLAASAWFAGWTEDRLASYRSIEHMAATDVRKVRSTGHVDSGTLAAVGAQLQGEDGLGNSSGSSTELDGNWGDSLTGNANSGDSSLLGGFGSSPNARATSFTDGAGGFGAGGSFGSSSGSSATRGSGTRSTSGLGQLSSSQNRF